MKLRKSRQHRRGRIEIIPMIDVMMFLLFFFMVASLAMVVQSGLPVNLPKASTANSHSSQNVTITIMANGKIYLNTTPTPLEGLKPGLQRMKVSPDNLVIINADKMVLHGLVVAAMDEARKAGITRFAIATDRD